LCGLSGIPVCIGYFPFCLVCFINGTVQFRSEQYSLMSAVH
jgi:hypothetical protein